MQVGGVSIHVVRSLSGGVSVEKLREFAPYFRVANATANPNSKFDSELQYHIKHLQLLDTSNRKTAKTSKTDQFLPLMILGESQSECKFLDTLYKLGTDALPFIMLKHLALHTKRSLACTGIGLAQIIGPHLRADTLYVLEEDAIWRMHSLLRDCRI